MALRSSKTDNEALLSQWLEPDYLMLLECWRRDGYKKSDVARKIGIHLEVLKRWIAEEPDIAEALRKPAEIVDYRVENALLKAAMGYETKETKVTCVFRFGKLIEEIKETTTKHIPPNVTAQQTWLYNRLPEKWMKNRESTINIDDEDQSIQVTVTRAPQALRDDQTDRMNESIRITKKGSTEPFRADTDEGPILEWDDD